MPLLDEYISFYISRSILMLKGDITPQEMFNNINIQNERFSKSINKHSQIFESSIKTTQVDTKVREQDIVQYSKGIKTLSELMKRLNVQDHALMIRNFILLVKDIDSFSFHFCRFINRLYHILTNNNRNYKDRPGCYFNIKTKPYEPKSRNLLKRFLSDQLKINFGSLADFLIIGFEFNEIRKLEAHEIPDNIKISDDKKIALIPQTGDEPDVQMDLENVNKFINSYCFFVDALGLY